VDNHEKARGVGEGRIHSITTAVMAEVDRVMVEDLGITLVQMMENAGRAFASLARDRFLGGDAEGRRVAVLAGSGANGGGVLSAARNLHNWGAVVSVYTTGPAEGARPATASQIQTLERIGIRPSFGAMPPEDGENDLIIDGIMGYGLVGAPRGLAARFIEWANSKAAPTLSMDVPSGLEAGTGRVHEPAIRAAATMTLALPKTGLLTREAGGLSSELYLADIGVPPEVYTRAGTGLEVGSIFSNEGIIRLY